MSGNQYVTDCPFPDCNKESHFYINVSNRCWDCKVCGRKGNYLGFLEQIAKVNEDYLKDNPEHLTTLAENKGLPVEAFKDLGLGFDGRVYTLPIYDYNKKFVTLRTYSMAPGNHWMNTIDTKAGLFGSDKLVKYESPVYICEGEWDAIAMRYLLEKTHTDGVVVGVPGANTFLTDWIEWFYQRTVYVLYDHDDAGVKGEMRVYGHLQNVAKTIQYLHWPPTKAEGWDLRDQITKTLVQRGKGTLCIKLLHEWMEDIPRELMSQSSTNAEGHLAVRENRHKNEVPITFPELVGKFQSYLYLKDITPIKVVLAVVLANRIHSDMVWLFLVAPPSSGKSEILNALALCEEIYNLGTLTSKTLVSGFNNGGQDPSLLPKLNGKVGLLKDFTSVLSLNPNERQEIFSQLREAYDKRIHKEFGNSVSRNYVGIRFGLIAAVTPRIEAQGVIQSTLGERFLRYYIPTIPEDLTKDSEAAIMGILEKSMSQVGYELEKRRSVQDATANFLRNHKMQEVSCGEEIRLALKYLSRYVANMRGIVERDFHGNMMYNPSYEGGARLSKQLLAMAIALASLEGRKEVSMDDYNVVCQIADSSCPDRIRSIVKVFVKNGHKPLTAIEVAKFVRMEEREVRLIVRDLDLLDIMKYQTVGPKKYYNTSARLQFLLKNSKIYDTPEMLNRPEPIKEDPTSAAVARPALPKPVQPPQQRPKRKWTL